MATRSAHFALLPSIGAIVGLVFAATESPVYCMDGGWGAVGERAITSVPLHAFHGAIIGYAVGKALHQGRWVWIPTAIAITSLLHGWNNFSTALLYRETADGMSTIPTVGIGAILVTDWPKNIVLLIIQIGLTFLLGTVGAFGKSRSSYGGMEASEKAADSAATT
jgi:PrsW family intramembrane metalloprotease